MFLLNSLLGSNSNSSLSRLRGATDKTGGVASDNNEAVVTYTPQPQLPPSHSAQDSAKEIRRFQGQFEVLAGHKMEVSPPELMDILNKGLARISKKTGRLGIQTCRSVLAVMDSETNGKLGFEEFKYLWNNVKKWQAVYKEHASSHSKCLGSHQLPGAFVAAGFQLTRPLQDLIVRRYSNDDGDLDFESFIGCLVRLDAMFRAFKSLEKDDSGDVRMNCHEWLQITLYS